MNTTKKIMALLRAIKLLFNYFSTVKMPQGAITLRWATASSRLNT